MAKAASRVRMFIQARHPAILHPSMNLLIAEDDPTTQTALKAMAARLGYIVQGVGDGRTALQALSKAEAPTLALLDWNMPGMDGLEVCRNIRLVGAETHGPCYLIVLTANREKHGVVEALQAGANDFVRKPYDFEELQARMAIGAKVLELEAALVERGAKLQASQERIAALQTSVHDCAACPGRVLAGFPLMI